MHTLSTYLPTMAGISWLLWTAGKASLLLAMSALGAALLRKGTAAARHQIWALGVGGALAMPLLCGALAALPVAVPGAEASFLGPALRVSAGPGPVEGLAWLPWLALPWALGTLAVGLRILRGQRAARRLWREAAPVPSARLRRAQQAAADALGLTRPVPLRLGGAGGSPMTIGVLRPRVILPAAAEAWSEARLHAVLLHELGHVVRQDTAVQLGAWLVCALYWWNPLAWRAAARSRVEREHAADDLVLRAGVRPSAYAADLLAVARDLLGKPTANAGAVCMATAHPSSTEARLRRILDPAAPRQDPARGYRGALRVLALAGAAAIAVPSAPRAAVPPSARLSVGVGYQVDLGNPNEEAPPPLLARADAVPNAVTAEVLRRLPALQQCYAQRLQTNPGLAGQVVLHWVILPTGEVAEQCITADAVGDSGLLSCVNALVQMGPFPAQEGVTVDVSYPFEFGSSS